MAATTGFPHLRDVDSIVEIAPSDWAWNVAVALHTQRDQPSNASSTGRPRRLSSCVAVNFASVSISGSFSIQIR